MVDQADLVLLVFQLISVNQPDLVLFVGEALVGNEAVDQLVKFNQALADHSQMSNPRLIDGIVLTKFDTIDDKVRRIVSVCGTSFCVGGIILRCAIVVTCSVQYINCTRNVRRVLSVAHCTCTYYTMLFSSTP